MIFIFQSVAGNVQAAYKEATKKDLKYEINSKKFLPSDSAGGLNVSNKNGSIIVSCYPIQMFEKKTNFHARVL